MLKRKNIRTISILVLSILLTFPLGPLNTYAASSKTAKKPLIALAQVKKPTLSSMGIAFWTNIANAMNYQVQLYKDGIPNRKVTATSGKTGYNFLQTMRNSGPGSYTVKVAALADGVKFKDGPKSQDSNPQIVVKATSVCTPNLSQNGIATWDNTNAFSYDLKLYKNGVLIDKLKSAASGYNYLEIMRKSGPGKYTVSVTVKSSTGLIIDGDESEQSEVQEVVSLGKMPAPTWLGNTLRWIPDDNASSYEIKLYKDGNLIDSEQLNNQTNSFDYGAIISKSSPGNFKATVQAQGSGLILDGEESELSFESIKAMALAQVGKPVFSNLGVVTWNKVLDAASYAVQLYCDGTEIGDPKIVPNNQLSCDLMSMINKDMPGSYTVVVTAKGEGEFFDGPKSEPSSELITCPVASGQRTVQTITTPAEKVNKYIDDIIVTMVYPTSRLNNGVETEFTVDVEYNLVSRDYAWIDICSNYGGDTESHMVPFIYKIDKGRGKLRFVIPIVPKNWGSAPFWISARLRNEDWSWELESPKINLKFY